MMSVKAHKWVLREMLVVAGVRQGENPCGESQWETSPTGVSQVLETSLG